MAVRKRGRPTKAGGTSRVKRIPDMAGWRSLLEKAGDRLVVVQFYQGSQLVCRQMRPIFTRLSTEPAYRRAVFAEVDVDACEDVPSAAGVRKVPTFQCYWQGELSESYSGGMPLKLQEMLQQQMAQHGGGGLGPLPKLLLAGAVLAAGVLAALRLTRSSGGEGGGSGGAAASAEVGKLAAAIGAGQQRLRALEKAGRGKQAKAQRLALKQLEARKRGLERGRQAAQQQEQQQPGAKAGSSGRQRSASPAAREGSAKGKEGGQQRQRRRRGAPAGGDAFSDDDDEVADERARAAYRRRATAATAARFGAYYSDEE